MFEHAEDELIERVIRQLRKPVAIDEGLDARVMREIAAVAGLVIAQPWSHGSGVRSDSYQFVLLAPQAASVALVGDFNDWDPARSPMRAAHSGLWATIVPLAPGRYHYAFLVNGVEWRRDPAAPAALDDDFGAPSSVVTVGGS